MDIYEVVSDFVNLKRSGSTYKALSPFTNEKTPSFYVVPAKGIFKDYSSGKGGDAISFIMEHEGLSYPEAIRFLAKKYGIEIRETKASEGEKEQASLRESLFLAMSFARDVFRRNLTETEEGRGIGLSYLRERGLDDQTIEKFELGYALDKRGYLEKEALRNGFSIEVLEKAGLVGRGEHGTYDRFTARVIFPIHGLSGKVIAFGGRILDKEKSPAKYINSPETDIYHKGDVLFGLFLAKDEIRKQDMCYMVEGYVDVIAMHQAGVPNVVAASGTAITKEHITLIKRFTPNVTMLFDGDRAGIKAAIRGIDMFLEQGMNVRVVLLPEGHDPDSYSRSVGQSVLLDYLRQESRDFIAFKAGVYSAEAGNDPIRRADSIREIVSSIAKVPDAIRRTVYVQETAARLKMPEPVLITELNKMLVRDRKAQPQAEPEPVEPEGIPEPVDRPADPVHRMAYQERETIRLLLNYADAELGNTRLAEFLFAELDDIAFSDPALAAIFKEMRERWEAGQPVDSTYFLANGSSDIQNLVADLVTPRYGTSGHWQDKYHIFFPQESELVDQLASAHVLRIKFRFLQSVIETNLSRIREVEASGDEEALDELLVRHQEFKNAERQLAEALGIVIAG